MTRFTFLIFVNFHFYNHNFDKTKNYKKTSVRADTIHPNLLILQN